jgi:hypothetical protein
VLARVLARLNDVLNVKLIKFQPHTDAELTKMAKASLRNSG